MALRLPWLQWFIWWILMTYFVEAGYYITADYYMDPTQSDAFGGVCEDYVQDDSMIINSHMNPFNLVSYGNDKRCWLVLDAGGTPGARYSLRVLKWKTELANKNGSCNDYLEIYDGDVNIPSNNATLYGRYCGNSAPNLTDISTQRYITLIWTTDRRFKDKGFRILAHRTESLTCTTEQFLCPVEKRCISLTIRCDGTEHCSNGADERGCSGAERFVGMFLRLGLGGMVAVGVCVLGTIVILTSVTCCVQCCKKSNKVTELVVSVRPDDGHEANGGYYGDQVEMMTSPDVEDTKDRY